MKFKPAKKSDVPSIVMMLANDKLGRKKEEFNNPMPKKYYDAFDAILNDENQELIIFENDEKEIIGTLTYFHTLSNISRWYKSTN